MLEKGNLGRAIRVMATILACTVSTSCSEKTMKETPNRLTRIVENRKTVCIGRFLVDIPKTAQVVYGPARVPVEIWRKEGQGSRFDEAVKDALAQVEKRRSFAYHGLLGQDSVLGQVMDGIGPNHKIVFAVDNADGAFYNVQSFLRLGDDLFIQEYLAYGEGKEYQETIKELNAVTKLLRSRANDEIPVEPGFCVDGAFFSEPSTYMRESVSVGVRLKEFSDVHISIEMIKKSYLVESDALEPRLRSAEREAAAAGFSGWYSNITTFRRGERNIGSWKGFEVLARLPAQKSEGESHEFAYVSQGEPKNALLPVLTVELHTGVVDNEIGRTKPTITDAEAIYLWDKITSSIRPRPVGVTR